jgi:argininosuccinate lyase
LPLAYNKDMQEDKEAIFDTFDTVSAALEITATVLRNVTVNEPKARHAALHGYMNATELADYLVRKGLPFREAHDTVGRIVLAAVERGVELDEMSLEDLQEYSSLLGSDVFAALSLEQTLATKSQIGGTAPETVATALLEARKRLSS